MKLGWTRITWSILLVPALILLTSACGDDTARPMDVEGFVHYSDTVPLPEDAMLTVELVDMTDMDQISVVKEQEIPLPDVIPATFRIEVMPDQIDRDHLYGIQARVTGGNDVLMLTKETYPVLTDGHPDSVSVIVYALEDASEVEYSGVLDEQDNVLVFTPCNSEYTYLIKADPLLMELMQKEYDDIIMDNPSGVFLVADAHIEENAGPDVIEDFDSTLIVAEIMELRSREPGDCRE